MLDFSLEKFDVLDGRHPLVLAGEGQHVVGHIQAVCLACQADPFCGKQNVDAAARTEIEYGFSGLELRKRVGLPQPSEANTAFSGKPLFWCPGQSSR
jgi:hypothetical protein